MSSSDQARVALPEGSIGLAMAITLLVALGLGATYSVTRIYAQAPGSSETVTNFVTLEQPAATINPPLVTSSFQRAVVPPHVRIALPPQLPITIKQPENTHDTKTAAPPKIHIPFNIQTLADWKEQNASEQPEPFKPATMVPPDSQKFRAMGINIRSAQSSRE